MFEFQKNSKENEPIRNDFWQGLNAASAALQKVAQSETAVYKVFSEQLIKLGLHGSISMLDDTGKNLNITALVFSERLMRVVRQAERISKLNSQNFSYPADASEADLAVLTKAEIIFLPDNSEKIRKVLSTTTFSKVAKFINPLLKIPAILAPLFVASKVKGVLYVAGTRLTQEDNPAIGAFANQLSIALENARLFQALQAAEVQYRSLFESANDGIFVFDPNSRHLLSANPKMLSLLQIDAADLGSIRPSDWAPPPIYQLYNHHFQIALEKGNHFFEVPFVDRQGNEKHWQISITVVELNGKPVLNGLVRDITEAKQAEVALRQREEQFRVLTENVPGTIYLCQNAPNFPVLYINEGIETLTGYPKEMFLRQEITFTELIHPDDQTGFQEPLPEKILTEGQGFCFMYRIRHRSGSWRWAEDVGGGVFDEQGNLLFIEGIISDVTERVQSNALQKAVYQIAAAAHTQISLNELYQSIHDSLGLFLDVQNFYIAIYDSDSDLIHLPYFVDKFDTHDGTHHAGFGLTELVVRQNRSQLLTRPQIQAIVNEGALKLRGTMPQVWLGVPLQSQGIAIGALVVQSYEETTAYSEQDRAFLTFVSEQIATVLERKQAEEQQHKLAAELRRQTQLLEVVLAATPDNFLVFDLDGRFQFVSSGTLDHLIFEDANNPGKSWQDLTLLPQISAQIDQGRARVWETGQSDTREYKIAHSQESREIEIVTNPVKNEAGQIVSFVTVVRDVTKSKQAMRAMNRAQKMESLGVLAGGIAHDFNNLLVAMLGQTSIAKAQLTQSHPAYAHVQKAAQAAEQAANLTRQLLAYSGGGQFTVKPIQLNDLISESMDLLKFALPPETNLQLNLTSGLPLIDADETQLRQLMMNLLINAGEAIEEQGRSVMVQTAVRTITSEHTEYWRYTGQPLLPATYLSLTVQDDGPGMAEGNISKIFDPFFTTKFTGRGLGLAAVLGIVRSHQGGLRVESQASSGTVFELLFPISEAPPQLAGQPEAHKGDDLSRVVLVIDDERAVREAVSDILELEGIEVLTAANGDEGIELYKAQAEQIDLILLDLSMPGKSGQETFRELQAFDDNVRIMLSSGFSEADATRGFDSPPLVGFMQKPYRVDLFVQELKKILHPNTAG